MPAILESIRRGEKVDRYETVRRRKDGSLVDISLTVSPILDGTGRPVGASKIARDITERKRIHEALRASEERFRYLANAVPDIVWTADPDGCITFANDRWFDFCGITPEQNARWPELVLHPDDRERGIAQWTRLTHTLALHELATNAAKYGALSSASGRVTLTARVERDEGGREFRLVWQEDGGPRVQPPATAAI
jgi:PAS domain S-box-containing protein